MTGPLTVFSGDRSQRWILVPGVASTRQIEIRNDGTSELECHLRVEEPVAASVSPVKLVIPGRHSRVADIVFLPNWSPANSHRALISVRNELGEALTSFSQELIGAQSADCNLALEFRDGMFADNVLSGLRLWCTISSRSSTPRRFEIEFVPHPALRFPDRRSVTLAPGESSAFEVPVRWNRSVRDQQGWNHPAVIEAFVPVTEGRRTALVPWAAVEQALGAFLSADDAVQKNVQPLAAGRSNGGQASPLFGNDDPVERKRLEQSVVAPSPSIGSRALEPLPDAQGARHRPIWATLVTLAFASVALIVAGLFYLRPAGVQLSRGPITVLPLKLSPAPPLNAGGKRVPAVPSSIASPAWSGVAHATVSPVRAAAQGVSSGVTSSRAPAAAPVRAPPPAPAGRSSVVGLGSVQAAWVQGGRAVNVVWSGNAQASAIVQVLDQAGKVLASRVIHGSSNDTTVMLPRGYRGPVSAEVTAIGYHGERVVQGATLPAQG